MRDKELIQVKNKEKVKSVSTHPKLLNNRE
jgi:hypothetical protein